MRHAYCSLTSRVTAIIVAFATMGSAQADITIPPSGLKAVASYSGGAGAVLNGPPPAGGPSTDKIGHSPSTALNGSLGANGWANMGWNVALGSQGGRITAGGSSTQGYNNFYLGGGLWFYGWGRTQFDLSFHFTQPYKYTVLSPTSRAAGFSGSSGFLPASLPTSDYHISGGSSGGPSGFSVDVQITVPSPAEAQVLQGVNSSFSKPYQALDSGGHSCWWVETVFRPNAPDIGTAAAALGGYTINFVSTIIDGPDAWEWIEGGVVVKASGAPMPPSGLADWDSGQRQIRDPRFSSFPVSVSSDPATAGSVEPLYFNNDHVNVRRSGTEIFWRDSPAPPDGWFSPGDKPLTFRTQAVVVDQNGAIKAYIGMPLEWHSDQTTNGGGIFIGITPDQDRGGPISGGSIKVGLPLPQIAVTSRTVATSQAVVSVWPVFPGFSYDLEYTDDLTTGIWNDVIRAGVSNSGTMRQLMDNSATGAKRFYRIRMNHP